MKDAFIKYYPVENGDTSLISLTDETKIIIDINLTEDADNNDVEHRFDVREDLLKELRIDGKIQFVDVFILSHPDQDHCRGFSKLFFTGKPDEYSENDLKNELIRIDELWFSPRVFTEFHSDLCEDAKIFKKEADRRMELHKNKSEKRNLPGNKIKIIGYSDDADLEGLNDVIIVPGNAINCLNGSTKSDFYFFIHAPFKNDTDNNDDRNDTSIVLQAIFDINEIKRAGLAIFGGDAGCNIWAKILEKSKSVNLEFDLFLASHHCSWKFFNTTSHTDKNSTALQSSIDILNNKRSGAIVISSSRTLLDNIEDKLPPHKKAKDQYENTVGGSVIITSEYPNKNNPKPIQFRITENGPQKIETKSTSTTSVNSLIGSATGKPKTYG